VRASSRFTSRRRVVRWAGGARYVRGQGTIATSAVWCCNSGDIDSDAEVAPS
jgi:hypothetical protein